MNITYTTSQLREANKGQVPQNVRILMALRGVTSAHQLAKMSGVTNTTISHLLNGRHEITSGVLSKLATTLQVSIVDLFRTDLINIK